MLLLIGENMKTRTIEREVWVSDSFINSGINIKKELDIKIFDFKRTKTSKYRNKAKIIIEVEEEPLTFERIKKECVPMETLLEFKGEQRLYLGFNRSGQLVTDCGNGFSSNSWNESEIKDWSIYNE